MIAALHRADSRPTVHVPIRSTDPAVSFAVAAGCGHHMKNGSMAAELVLTCEHGGNRIPRRYAPLFAVAARELASHRGWDPGALALARCCARILRRPLLAVTWSRLLVDANRSPHNPRIWSCFTADLPRVERLRILDRWWQPHRQRVEAAIAAAMARGRRVVHIAVHSFTPVLDGEQRNADIALLYDSKRRAEVALCRRWRSLLRRRLPVLRLRCNYPYTGRSDGLTTWLRRQHPPTRYLGIELEVNQALVDAPGWRRLRVELAASLGELIGGHAGAPPPGRGGPSSGSGRATARPRRSPAAR